MNINQNGWRSSDGRVCVETYPEGPCYLAIVRVGDREWEARCARRERVETAIAGAFIHAVQALLDEPPMKDLRATIEAQQRLFSRMIQEADDTADRYPDASPWERMHRERAWWLARFNEVLAGLLDGRTTDKVG